MSKYTLTFKLLTTANVTSDTKVKLNKRPLRSSQAILCCHGHLDNVNAVIVFNVFICTIVLYTQKMP